MYDRNGRTDEEVASLRQEFEKLKEYLIDWSPDAVVVVDSTGSIIAVNRAAEAMFGYPKSELLGQLIEILIPRNARGSHTTHRNQYHQAPRHRPMGQSGTEFFAQRKDGSVFPADINLNPFKLEGTTIAAIRDITSRKQIEQSLREAKEQAEAAAQAKNVFLASMSHEFRTPLNAILGFTQLLETSPNLSPQEQKFVAAIRRGGEHLLEIIGDVLNMARIETGRITHEPRTFDLFKLLDELTSIFRQRAELKSLRFVVQRAPNLPPALIGDEGKLRQILLNLLGNAVKFTFRGAVSLHVSWKDGIGRFVVADTGPGIPEAEQGRIFNPFVQTNTQQNAREGTGLGLAICKKYLELMGGTITVASQLGSGSTFSFEIPLALAQGAASSSATEFHFCTGLEPGQSSVRLLVVDDNPDDCEFLSAVLARLGFETRIGNNGHEAVETWKSWSPHLIWMNLSMPIMDGLEATKKIRELETTGVNRQPDENSRLSRTVVIAVAANTPEQVAEQISQAGLDDFLAKPIQAALVYEKIHQHLGVRFRFGGESPQPPPEALPVEEIPPPDWKTEVARMPADWKEALYQALLQGDTQAALDLLKPLQEPAPAVAEELRQHIRNFAFDELLDLLESA
ncbi:MAG: PAS domain S-box protein [Blastocatellia bacterium]|nr:PAS domain S-box protein [Blastocatellia bacterium]